MATTINADNVTGGAIVTGDASGQLELQAAGVTKATISSGGVALSSALPVSSGGTGATSLTANNVLLGNGTSAVQVVAPGSSGNVLTSNGTTWQSVAPAGGGMHTLLSTVTASGASTVDIGSSSEFTSTYDEYFIYTPNATFSANNNEVYARVSVATTIQTAGYIFTARYSVSDTTGVSTQQSTGSANLEIVRSGVRSESGSVAAIKVWISNPSSTSLHKPIRWESNVVGSFYGANSSGYTNGSGHFNNNTSAVDSFQIRPASGTISGDFYLFGVVKQ